MAAKPKKTAKKLPGVTSSKTRRPTPAANHIHQIKVDGTLARGQEYLLALQPTARMTTYPPREE